MDEDAVAGCFIIVVLLAIAAIIVPLIIIPWRFALGMPARVLTRRY